MKKAGMPKSDDGYTKARLQMPSVMALNKDPTAGKKRNPQPPPKLSNTVAFSKGGKVAGKK